jgi:hypothetical protein
MTHNKEGLQIGEIVHLDVEYTNSSLVQIVSFSPSEMFAMVKVGDTEWEVMTNRLTRTTHKGISNAKKIEP